MATNKAWQECLDEAKEVCEFCNGYGYTVEHDPCDPHIDGVCSYCPIQVQCHPCKAIGYKYNYQLAAEKYAVRFAVWTHTEQHFRDPDDKGVWFDFNADGMIGITSEKLHQRFIEENNK